MNGRGGRTRRGRTAQGGADENRLPRPVNDRYASKSSGTSSGRREKYASFALR